MLTDEEQQTAKKIVDELVWQPAEGHHYRYSHAVNSITRYCEAASMEPDVVRLVIEYLRNEVIDGGICMLNKRMDLGDGWKAMDAWYQTVVSEKFAGTDSSKVRIYQVLIKAPADESGDGPYVIEDGCQYKVSHTFHWNVEELPLLPESSSGVMYTMQGVSRDSTTGLFSCVIECRERVQQDVAEYETERTVFEIRKEELHLGVKAENLDSTGKPASVGDGTLVARKVSKNPDCTSDVQNVTIVEDPESDAVVEYSKTLRGTSKTTTNRNQASPLAESGLAVGETRRSEKTPGGRYNNTTEKVTPTAAGKVASSCSKTIFSHGHSTTKNQTSEPSNEASAAGNGVTHQVSVRKTDNGTFDVTTEDITETPVSDAVVEYRKTLRGTVKTTTNRNQASPLAESGLAVGETRRSEKTPGGRYNNVVSKTTPDAAGVTAEECTNTIYEHRHATTKNVATDPQVAHAGEAGNGKTHQVSVSKNEDNSFDVRTVDTEENSVSEAEKSVSVGLSGTVETTVNRNMPEPANADNLDVGDSVSNAQTPGGRWIQTIRKVIRNFQTRLIGENCVKTVFQHVHSKTNIQGFDPGAVDVSAAGDGKVQRRTVTRIQDGTFQIADETTNELPIGETRLIFRRTAAGLVIREESRNQPEPLSEDQVGSCPGDTAESRMTEGGRYDNAVEYRRQNSEDTRGKVEDSCLNDYYKHTHDETHNYSPWVGMDPDNASAETPFTPGKLVQKNLTKREDGSTDEHTKTITPNERRHQYSWKDNRGTHTVIKYFNAQSGATQADVPLDASTSTVEDSVNEFGLHDGRIAYSYLSGGGGGSGSWSGTKHGTPETQYFSYINPKTQKRMCCQRTVKRIFYGNGAYSSFMDDYLSANPLRQNSGVMACKLMRRSQDSNGNPLADWVVVQAASTWSNPAACNHTHGEHGDGYSKVLDI